MMLAIKFANIVMKNVMALVQGLDHVTVRNVNTFEMDRSVYENVQYQNILKMASVNHVTKIVYPVVQDH